MSDAGISVMRCTLYVHSNWVIMYSKLTALVEHSEIVGQKSFRRTWNNKNIQKVKVSSSDLHRKQREMVRCRRGTPGSSGREGTARAARSCSQSSAFSLRFMTQ